MITGSLTNEEINVLRERSMKDLYFFAKAILGFDWLDKDIHLPLCRLLENYADNNKMRIILPRGWLKTTLCSQAYPIWRSIRNPNIRVLLTQNTFTNAVAKLRVIKLAFEDNILLKLLFPELMPGTRNVWKQESLCINRPKAFNESTFEAAGVRTQVTSRHYDIIIEDDTVAPDYNELGEQNICPTKEDIDLAIGWHRLALPLLNSPLDGQILVVGTRWFEKDLLSWIGDNETMYKSYMRACLETNGEPDVNGEPVYPARFGRKALKLISDGLGPYLFSCLYMNLPVRSGDMLFDLALFKYYEEEPIASRLVVYTTIDPAGDPEQTKGKPDYNVVMTCGKDLISGRVYVLEYTRKKCSPGEIIEHIFRHVRKWHPVKVAVESVAYQGTLQYWIKERMRKEKLYFFVDGFTHGRREKNARIMGLQPLIAAGKMYFRRNMPELVNELLSFPNGAYDDIIDALSSQLRFWAATKSREEEKELSAGGALDFDSVVEELRGRDKKEINPPYDMLYEREKLCYSN